MIVQQFVVMFLKVQNNDDDLKRVLHEILRKIIFFVQLCIQRVEQEIG